MASDLIIDPSRMSLDQVRATSRAQLRQAIRALMFDVIGDERLLAAILVDGPFNFRRRFAQDLGAFGRGNMAQIDSLADVVFRFFETQWARLHPGVTPGEWTDSYCPPALPTQDEIDQAWEVEIGSDDAYMRQVWDGSARTRKGRLEDLGLKRDLPADQAPKV